MTPTPTTANDNAHPASPPSSSPPASRWSRLGNWLQFIASLMLTAGVLVYLLWSPDSGAQSAREGPRAAPEETVRLSGAQCIWIKEDCPLSRKLQVITVQSTEIRAPILTVTGTVIASLRPGNGKGTDYWQFNSPELLTAFTDWQKATADIEFTETQLSQIKLLAETRTSAQQKLVDRLQKLVAAGTDTEKDLAAAQAELIQAQISGRKDVHEAETAVRLARRTEAALARQLEQAGLEPELLQSAKADVDIVLADVPEGMMSRVKVGQECAAQFFGFPDQSFSGTVRAIAPVLSKERRTLRVLFAIHDPQDQLRPGIFAEVGLGTEARTGLLVPAEGIVHVGRSDYVLVDSGDGNWRVTAVQVGELHEAAVEIHGGLRAGDRVAGQGAILLKPYIVQVVQTHGSPPTLQARAATAGDRS